MEARTKEHEQPIIRLLLSEKEAIRQKLAARVEKGRKEILLIGENQQTEMVVRGFAMLQCAFGKMLDLYFEKIMGNFMLIYSEAELMRTVRAVEVALKKSTSTFVKQLKDHLRCKEAEISVEKKPKKFTDRATRVLKEYLMSHFDDPYPSNEDKEQLAAETGLTVGQVNNWFVNTRERLIKRFYRKESVGHMLKKMCS